MRRSLEASGISVVCRLAALGALLFWADNARAIAVNPDIVIRQVYGGGGNSGATYTNDFVELFNRGALPVTILANSWSVQYTSPTGTGNLGAGGLITVLPAVTLQPGQSLLVQEGAGAGAGVPLPAADVTGSIAMGAAGGKVALVASPSGLGCNGSSTLCTQAQLDLIVDLVGYGNANFAEGSPAPTPSATLSVQRNAGGCTDSNANSADFSAFAVSPRNSASPLTPCGGGGGVIGPCGGTATLISTIQGSQDSSPLIGTTVNVEAVVVGDFQDGPLNGFYLQQSDATVDADPATSEGLFIYEGALNVPVALGNVVRVRGQVSEYNSLTELTSVTDVVVCGGSGTASTQTLAFPVSQVADLERYEGMSVFIAQPLTVSGNFDLGRFGSLDLSVGGRLMQPTNVVSPGTSANALQALNDRSRIILDDLSDTQNPNPIPYKDANNTRRVGDTLPSLRGILDGRFAAYRIEPTEAPTFSNANPRQATPPAVGGRLRVAAANTLNFFTTLDVTGNTCGPSSLQCRGANTAVEFDRQREKLLNELSALNADVIGLMEIENNARAATQSLVDGLNARLGAGTYGLIDTGVIGTDAIKVALIYKPAKVAPVGAFALLTSAVDARFVDTKNRPSLAQSFAEVASGERFTVVVNHLKSKGSDCNDIGDPDALDGQGNCNGTRTNAAAALASWLATDPTHVSDPDYLLIGDFNAYSKEQPLATLKSSGFELLTETRLSGAALSFQFEGQSGALDHGLASSSMSTQVSAVAEWHSNADEPSVLDYNTEFKTDDPFNPDDPFRGSDHDPLLIGLQLGQAQSVPALGSWSPVALGWLLAALGASLVRITGRPRKRA